MSIIRSAGARPIGIKEQSGRPCALTRTMLSTCAIGARSESDKDVPRVPSCIRKCLGTPLSPSHVYHLDSILSPYY